MKLIISFNNQNQINPNVYHDFCYKLYLQIVDTIKDNINPIKYKIREKAVLSLNAIEWNHDKPPAHVDLIYYIENCLDLYKEKDIYYIALNDRMLVKGSTTHASYLVRLLEYGAPGLPPYPYVRSILRYYEENYKRMFINL